MKSFEHRTQASNMRETSFEILPPPLPLRREIIASDHGAFKRADRLASARAFNSARVSSRRDAAVKFLNYIVTYIATRDERGVHERPRGRTAWGKGGRGREFGSVVIARIPDAAAAARSRYSLLLFLSLLSPAAAVALR